MSGEELEGRVHRSALIRYGIAGGIGLLASSLHWGGLLLGGILVGLLAPSTRRGIGYGAVWGGFAWLVFLGVLATAGIVPTGGMAQLFGVSLGAAVTLGAVGGSARELRPVLRAQSRER